MKTPPGKVKIYRILKNPKRRYAYAQLVKSNITSIEERDKLIKKFRKECPKDKFFWNYEYRTKKQIESTNKRRLCCPACNGILFECLSCGKVVLGRK